MNNDSTLDDLTNWLENHDFRDITPEMSTHSGDPTSSNGIEIHDLSHSLDYNDLQSLNFHHHFDPNHVHGVIIGNPTEEMNYWHQQIAPDACGIATQQSAIEHITHQSYSQEQLLDHAQENHWYSPHIGTNAEDFGKLITEQTGVNVEHHYGGDINEIAHQLSQHEEVFVGVNSDIINLPDHNSILGQAAPDLFDPRHYQGVEANHIVQVTGLEIDQNHPDNSYVVINDSSSPDGCGLEIPIDQFQEAMKASHGYIASTEIHHHNLTENPDHSMTFRGCDDYSFASDRNNFYVNGDIRGHCHGNKIYTGNYYTDMGETYKGCVKDMNIYDAHDHKVGYLDGCGNVHKNDGTIILSGNNHSGFANAAYYLLNLIG
jgi:hypothetical protein